MEDTGKDGYGASQVKLVWFPGIKTADRTRLGDRSGRMVANGVYFYQVRSAGRGGTWGKIAVLD